MPAPRGVEEDFMKKINLLVAIIILAMGVPSIAQAQANPEEIGERLKLQKVVDQRVEDFYKEKDATERAQRAPQQVAQASEGDEVSLDELEGAVEETQAKEAEGTQGTAEVENYALFSKTAFAEIAYEGGNGKSAPESVASGVVGFSANFSLASKPDPAKTLQDWGIEARMTGIFSSNKNLTLAGVDPGVTRFAATLGGYSRIQLNPEFWVAGSLGGGVEMSDREGFTNGGLFLFQVNAYLFPNRWEQNVYHPNEIHSALEFEALYQGVFGSQDARRDWVRYRLFCSPFDQHWFSFGPQLSYLEYDVDGPDFQGWDYGGVIRLSGFDWVKEHTARLTASVSAGPNRGPNAFVGVHWSWF